MREESLVGSLAEVVPAVKSRGRSSRSSRTRVLITMMLALSLRVVQCAKREIPIGPSHSARYLRTLRPKHKKREVFSQVSKPQQQRKASAKVKEPKPVVVQEDKDLDLESKRAASFYGDAEPADKKGSDVQKEVPVGKVVGDQAWKFGRYATRLLRRGGGMVISAGGFVSSSTEQLVTDTTAAQRWKPTVRALKEFLKTTGIDLELSKSLNASLLHNVILLGRVQSKAFADKDRRDSVLKRGRRHQIPSNEEALRYMKYSTAAYGDSMITAVEVDVKGTVGGRMGRSTRTRISDHIGVPEDDIVLMDVNHNGDSNHLRHFVAIDHENREVVLSIRGTFSLSEMVVDVAGFSRPFCGGEAHSEMANMAERVWDVAGSTVRKMLKEHKGYDFVITGHSLGAGAAALLNILCHRNGGEAVGGRNTRCFGYATPPVFTPLELAQKSVNSCTTYVHEADAIPFLSIDSVRHFFSIIEVIEDYSQKAPWFSQLKLTLGFSNPEKVLLEEVGKATAMRLVPKSGAPRLEIPSANVVWMKEKPDTGMFDSKVCDSRRMATLGIGVDPNMLQDHFPPSYEHALHNLEEK